MTEPFRGLEINGRLYQVGDVIRISGAPRVAGWFGPETHNLFLLNFDEQRGAHELVPIPFVVLKHLAPEKYNIIIEEMKVQREQRITGRAK